MGKIGHEAKFAVDSPIKKNIFPNQMCTVSELSQLHSGKEKGLICVLFVHGSKSESWIQIRPYP